jgi:hypothetical protein
MYFPIDLMPLAGLALRSQLKPCRFLLAQFHLGSLANMQTPKDVRQAVKNLPTSLTEKYDEVMDRIASQDDNDAQLGRKVLSWISHAKRPLTVVEMQHAVKVESAITRIEEDDLISQDILVSVCAGIVTVDKESNVIRLVHYTAQEYLLKHRSTHFPNGERDAANACLTYFSFDNFRNGYCETDEALESLLKENALLDYAARHWADHAREVTESVMGAALNFLQDTSRTSMSFQVMTIGPYRYGGYSQGPSSHMSGLHLCAYFGMHFIPMIIRMLDTQPKVDVYDSSGKTPLWWAAAKGHEAIVKLLLEKGADIDSKDNNNQTPLSWAAAEGHEAVVKLLLKKGADADSKTNGRRTPLSRAAAYGHEAVVKLLLEKGANVDSEDNDTPLSWAAARGHKAVVKLLLEKGANVYA